MGLTAKDLVLVLVVVLLCGGGQSQSHGTKTQIPQPTQYRGGYLSLNEAQRLRDSQRPTTIEAPVVKQQPLPSVRVPKQIGVAGAGGVKNGVDNQQSGTHFEHMGHHGGHGLGHHGGLHGDSKYFQYAHNPAYDEYEFGYRRGNDYHFQERYERGGPGWSFKTKVKWGDKHAGYGEHYWDYNHADKGHGHGWGWDEGGSGGGGGGGGGGGSGSENVAAYEKPQDGAPRPQQHHHQRLPHKRDNNSGKGQMQQPKGLKRVKGEEASPIPATPLREAMVQAPSYRAPVLSLDPKTGRIVDEETGRSYVLKPFRE